MRVLVFLMGLVLAAATATAGTTQAVDPQTDAADAAIDYILTQQNPDGGFVGFGEESSPGVTLDAVFALLATGMDPTAVEADGNSPLDYLGAQAAEYATDPGSAAKLAYGVSAAGLDPADIAGLDLTAIMADGYNEATGKYGIDLFDHAFYLFAQFVMAEAIPTPAVEYLRSAQLDDGGWEFDAGFASDSNTTAMVVQALIAAGVPADDPAITGALDYFASVQDASGAFAFLADTDPDAQSTGFVIQALVAAGEDLDTWAVGGVTPMDALLAFQNPETGAFQFAGEDSPFATYQVVPGLLLAPLPELQTLPDGEPAPTPEPEETVAATATPEPPAKLPETGAGAGAGTGAEPWWLLGAAIAGAAVVGSAAVAARRRG